MMMQTSEGVSVSYHLYDRAVLAVYSGPPMVGQVSLHVCNSHLSCKYSRKETRSFDAVKVGRSPPLSSLEIIYPTLRQTLRSCTSRDRIVTTT